MSPCTSRSSFFIAVAMPRCGQPVQSTGGRGMTETSSAAFSSAQRGRSRPAAKKPRPTRTAVSSPHCGNHCLPSQAMPAARICSSRYGSSSSTTNSRSTVCAKARMASTGSGWIMPSLRKAAPGSASLALSTPPRRRPRRSAPTRRPAAAPGRRRARPGPARRRRRSPPRTRADARRARAGCGAAAARTSAAGSTSRSCGPGAGARAPAASASRGSSPSAATSPSKRTMLFWCAVWMLRRTITGTSNSSLIAKARLAYS